MKSASDFPTINAKIPDGLKEDGSKYRVLLVDDSIFVKKQLQQMLLSQDYEVVDTAADGEEAVAKYKQHYPNIDLVTMDITMPKMDGLTALEQIIEFDRSAKVVMISALGKEELVKKALLLGARNFISKPLDRVKVLERLASVVKR